MEKDVPSDLFANDGSFMEKFKQLQKGNQEKAVPEESKSTASSGSGRSSKPVAVVNKKALDMKLNDAKNSGGKLAFSLKQKSKAVVPVIKLGADEDDDEGSAADKEVREGPLKRLKFEQSVNSERSFDRGIVVPPPPSDPAVKSVADRLATFVAKNGRQLENVTRQKNPGDTPFRFLFDPRCSDYKYYEYRILEEEKLLAQVKESQASQVAANTSGSSSRLSSGSRLNSHSQQTHYHTSASALYEINEKPVKSSSTSIKSSWGESTSTNGEGDSPAAPDPLTMMEYYMKKAAQEERIRQPRQSKDEMPPPASLQASVKKGHHMGDYIPPEELQKFLATCNDAASQKAAREAAERNKIQADNVGHRLLSKMGWKEGEGLGSSGVGRADPVMAGDVKQNNLGVGAQNPGEVTAEDDIYEQYKKRMMLGYRYRPNPLNNPRKQYY